MGNLYHKQERYTLKKLSVGLASVALGASFMVANETTVEAQAQTPGIQSGQAAYQASGAVPSYVDYTVNSIRQARGMMYDDPSIPFENVPLSDYVTMQGLTRDQYINNVQYDHSLQVTADRRAVETAQHGKVGHFAADGTSNPSFNDSSASYENLAWGYDIGSAYNAWINQEVDDLKASNGKFTYENGHLYQILNPKLRSFAYSEVIGGNAYGGRVGALVYSSQPASAEALVKEESLPIQEVKVEPSQSVEASATNENQPVQHVAVAAEKTPEVQAAVPVKDQVQTEKAETKQPLKSEPKASPIQVQSIDTPVQSQAVNTAEVSQKDKVQALVEDVKKELEETKKIKETTPTTAEVKASKSQEESAPAIQPLSLSKSKSSDVDVKIDLTEDANSTNNQAKSESPANNGQQGSNATSESQNNPPQEENNSQKEQGQQESSSAPEKKTEGEQVKEDLGQEEKSSTASDESKDDKKARTLPATGGSSVVALFGLVSISGGLAFTAPSRRRK